MSGRVMGELGERLQAARQEKELTLEQVAEATRIPRNYLAALEEESVDAFSSELHGRGFLRNYASFLGLDVADTVRLYDQLSPPTRGRPTSTAANGASRRDNNGPSTLATDALLILVALTLLALGGFSAYLRQNQVEPTPTPGPPPSPTPTPLPVFEGTAYTMDVYLDYAQHKLAVQERIDYTNVTSETLSDLLLNVHPNHSRGSFALNKIEVEMRGEVIQPDFSTLDITLRVDLPHDLRPDDHVTLYLDFTLNLPEIDPDAQFVKASFGYSKRALTLGHWYPVLAPYREEKGWYGQTFFPIGDPYVTEVADYRVVITATDGVILAGTGHETREGNRWQYEAEQARSFAFAASDKYMVSSAQAGDITVLSYYFPANQEAGDVALETAVRALELFSELYGPYPYAAYRVCETEFAGGLEFSGLTLLGSPFYDGYDGTTRTPLIPLTVHEVSHQWFYGLVGNDQVTQPWLDEAPAEYSAFLYYERHLPDDTDWWWTYAVDQWVPTGVVDSYIFEFRNDSRPYYDAVYRRGAQFMHDLRDSMGDPAFFGFLQEYQRRNAYRLATSRDFFSLVQTYTTADLVPLQEEYFRQLIRPQTR
jgi:transcriptional regulator with XRE-family HTH domain